MQFLLNENILEYSLAVLRQYWYIPLLLGAAKIVYLRWFSPLSKFPGPFFAHVTNWYSVWTFFSHRMERIELDLHKKYGDVVRYQPNLLLFSDPKMLPIIYSRNADKDPDFYGSGGLAMGPNVFNSIPHGIHTKMKKRVASSFSMTSVRTMEYLMDGVIVAFMSKMNRFAESGETINFGSWSQFFTYDIMSELAFGKAYGFITQEKDLNNLLSGFKTGLPLFGLTSRMPVMNKILCSKLLAPMIVPKPTDKEGFGAVMGFRDHLLGQRFGKEAVEKGGPVAGKERGAQKDIVHYIVNSENPDGTPITLKEAKDELLFLMLAGADTAANIFRQTICRVLEHPGYYERLTAEIDEAYATGKLTLPVVRYDEATSLSLLNAIIKETLRFDATVASILPRVAPKGGFHINGLFVPEGTIVAANAWVTGRHRGLYGSDAELWRPERWLENPEKVKEMEKYDFTFGYGSRVCLGKNVALLEMYKVICQFFLHYRPELVDHDKNSPRINLGPFFQDRLFIKIHKRELAARNVGLAVN